MKCLALLLCLGCGCVQASEALDDRAARAQIQQERTALNAKAAQLSQACREQFLVTPCLDKVRADTQAALQGLRTREQVLDDAQRHRRSLEQAHRVASKAQAAEAREEAASAPMSVRRPKPPRVHLPSAPASVSAASASASERSALEQQRRTQFEARRREIQQHREAAERRNVERAAKKPAKPLPVPTSAAGR